MRVGFNPNNQTFPPVRQNIECGMPGKILAGRKPLQLNWYRWASRLYTWKSVLDIGCGSCVGLGLVRNGGAASVVGQEVDVRLAGLEDDIIFNTIDNIPSKNYDVVLCIDVIEHVIEDFEFFRHLVRIAKNNLMITTPNYACSKARNQHHCREYTIPQFVEFFAPDELWVSASGGVFQPTRLTASEIMDTAKWANICGIWKMEG
mgnify:CR=1 FL=1